MKRDHPSIWVVVQEGGSSTEIYLHLYDTERQAKAGARRTEAATYNVITVDEIPKEGPERVAWRMLHLCEDLMKADPKTPLNGFRRRLKTLVQAAKEGYQG